MDCPATFPFSLTTLFRSPGRVRGVRRPTPPAAHADGCGRAPREWPAPAEILGRTGLFRPPRPVRRIPVSGRLDRPAGRRLRSEAHTAELQSRLHLVCRLL